MSVSSIYLEGFLAAARPGDHAVPPAPPAPVAEVGTEPVVPPAGLSFEEETKRRLHPLDSFARLLDGASANRPPDAEDAFRFQWFGLFYQAPEQDAFILRLRLPGGRLKPFQLAGLAEVTQRYASGQVVLNAQGGLDIAGVPLTAAARVLHEVESIGLSARRTGGDCVQAIRGGEDEDDGPTGNPAAIYPLVCALEQALAQSPVFSDLPLPCQIVFQTDDAPATVQGWVGDTLILRAASERAAPNEPFGPTLEPSFLLVFPDDPGTGFPLTYDRVVPGCLALLQSWATGADRSTRAAASLAGFLATLGPDALGTLLDGAKPVSPTPESKRGAFFKQAAPPPGLAVPGGRLLSGQLTALAQCCRDQDWHEIRLAHGHLLVVGVSGEIVEVTPAQAEAWSA